MEALLEKLVPLVLKVGPEIVFATTFVETSIFVGLIIPAEAVVLLAGALAALGQFSLSHVLLATCGGAFLGDQTGYALGRFGGNRVVMRGGYISSVWHYYEPIAARLFRRRAAVSVTLARFISFVRTLMPWFAGMSCMPYSRFIFFDLLGVLGWGFGSVAVGYAAGKSWRVAAQLLGTASAYALGAAAVLVVIVVVRRKSKERALAKQLKLRVALTGNIASGKSTVAATWRALGAAIIDADELSRQAVAPPSPGFRKVVAAFGPQVVSNGELDRAALRNIVFNEETKRKLLESIVHPEVARLRDLEEKKLLAQGERIIINDIPLLFEAELVNDFDIVVLVDAPEDVRIQRMVEQRGLSEEEARKMAAAQMPSSEKRLPGTYIIENDGTLEDLRSRATQVWYELQERVL